MLTGEGGGLVAIVDGGGGGLVAIVDGGWWGVLVAIEHITQRSLQFLKFKGNSEIGIAQLFYYLPRLFILV